MIQTYPTNRYDNTKLIQRFNDKENNTKTPPKINYRTISDRMQGQSFGKKYSNPTFMVNQVYRPNLSTLTTNVP